MGIVVPKQAETDFVTLGCAIAIGVLAGSVSIGGFGLGTGLAVLLAGSLMGYLHDRSPRIAGFPPQAVQIFSDFGLRIAKVRDGKITRIEVIRSIH